MAKIHVWLETTDNLDGDTVYVFVQSMFPVGLALSTYADTDSSHDFWLEAYQDLKEHECAYNSDEITCGASLCDLTNMWKLRRYQDEYMFLIESVLGLWFDNGEPIENCEIIMEIPDD